MRSLGKAGMAELFERNCHQAARFADGPLVSAPESAEQRLGDWLSDLAPEQARAVDGLLTRFPRAKAILSGVAEASPYLFDLVRANVREPVQVEVRVRLVP